jgi:hypothetical protein
MKKLILLVLLLLLIGCKENIEVTTSDQLPEELVEVEIGQGLWYHGEAGLDPIKLQFSELNGTLVGKVQFREEEMTIRGELNDEIYTFIGEGYHIEFVEENDQLLGVFANSEEVLPLQLIKDNIVFKAIRLSEKGQLRNGTYQGLKSTEFFGATIKVTALFDHLIFVELNGYNGHNIGNYKFLAIDNGDSYMRSQPVKMVVRFTEHHEVHLFTDDFTYGCEEDVRYDNRYSESYQVPVLSLIQKGVANSEEENHILMNLLGDDYT